MVGSGLSVHNLFVGAHPLVPLVVTMIGTASPIHAVVAISIAISICVTTDLGYSGSHNGYYRIPENSIIHLWWWRRWWNCWCVVLATF